MKLGGAAVKRFRAYRAPEGVLIMIFDDDNKGPPYHNDVGQVIVEPATGLIAEADTADELLALVFKK